jgi:hypothetical protein
MEPQPGCIGGRHALERVNFTSRHARIIQGAVRSWPQVNSRRRRRSSNSKEGGGVIKARHKAEIEEQGRYEAKEDPEAVCQAETFIVIVVVFFCCAAY